MALEGNLKDFSLEDMFRLLASGDKTGTLHMERKDAEGKPFIPLTYHLHDKYPYPTQTRRIQFYIDHDLYLEHDEHLPTYKAPPKIGGDYPRSLVQPDGPPAERGW